jgi:hypothetical protein
MSFPRDYTLGLVGDQYYLISGPTIEFGLETISTPDIYHKVVQGDA